jgi:hypothetical protein
MGRALCALALGCASAAHADFSWELAGLASQSERRENFESVVANFESDVVSLSGTYYLDAVADGSGPLALAAFLDPTTNVLVEVSGDEITTEIGAQAFEVETKRYSVGGTYVFAQSKWYAGGRYSSGELDEPPPQPPPAAEWSDGDETEYRVVAGKYLGSGATRLELGFEQRTVETEQWADPCVIICSASAKNTYDVERLDVMHVGRFREATYALFGGISKEDARIRASLTVLSPGGPPLSETFDAELGRFDAYAIGAELYPVPSVGVRVGYRRATGPTSADVDTVDVGVGWFFRRNIGLELTFSSEDPDFGARTEQGSVRVIGRVR